MACQRNRNLSFCHTVRYAPTVPQAAETASSADQATPSTSQVSTTQATPSSTDPLETIFDSLIAERKKDTESNQTTTTAAPETTTEGGLGGLIGGYLEKAESAASNKTEANATTESYPFGDPNSFTQTTPSSKKVDASTTTDPFGNPANHTSRPETAKSRNATELQKQCLKILPIASKFCNNTKNAPKSIIEKCKAFARDCYDYIPKAHWLDQLKKLFSSSVGLVPEAFELSGIPFYPINEEGAIGQITKVDIPFGTFGGGYSEYKGVRDFWSQYFETGANWIDGEYGYRTGWSVPMVQSLGVEGGGGTHVSVPLKDKYFGKIGVDTGYGIGPYYDQNDHVGVDWREGNYNHQVGFAVPIVGVGLNRGTVINFPSYNAWMRALQGY